MLQKYIILHPSNKRKAMTIEQINNERDERGVFTTGNDVSGWFAISRDGIHMIWYFKREKRIFYTEKGFAKRITQLIVRG
jgi:hypothetical protein